tara:strand:+ start:532 stop:639 length:108 start_codon:yes stop_codon:yes gene_type:complete
MKKKTIYWIIAIFIFVDIVIGGKWISGFGKKVKSE